MLCVSQILPQCTEPRGTHHRPRQPRPPRRNRSQLFPLLCRTKQKGPAPRSEAGPPGTEKLCFLFGGCTAPSSASGQDGARLPRPKASFGFLSCKHLGAPFPFINLWVLMSPWPKALPSTTRFLCVRQQKCSLQPALRTQPKTQPWETGSAPDRRPEFPGTCHPGERGCKG